VIGLFRALTTPRQDSLLTGANIAAKTVRVRMDSGGAGQTSCAAAPYRPEQMKTCQTQMMQDPDDSRMMACDGKDVKRKNVQYAKFKGANEEVRGAGL